MPGTVYCFAKLVEILERLPVGNAADVQDHRSLAFAVPVPTDDRVGFSGNEGDVKSLVRLQLTHLVHRIPRFLRELYHETAELGIKTI